MTITGPTDQTGEDRRTLPTRTPVTESAPSSFVPDTIVIFDRLHDS